MRRGGVSALLWTVPVSAADDGDLRGVEIEVHCPA